MTMPKRGSRRIIVDGEAYRWVVGPNDGYMVLAVERADGSGRRLEAYFRYHDQYETAGAGSYRVVGQRRSIRPGVVRTVILYALARGWQPSTPGREPFRVRDADSLVPVEGEEM
ncbi:MAG: hypothetical protein K2X87_09730 [Gemmataceae bacterium]|nr:hypothetical protein [Gemmataceae bacterium]